MTRFSLESTFRDDDDDSDNDSLFSPTSCSTSSYQGDSDNEYEEPHPLGFGVTRFGLYEWREKNVGRCVPFDDIENAGSLEDYFYDRHKSSSSSRCTVQQPILQNSHDTKLLMRHYYNQIMDEKCKIVDSLTDNMDRIAAIVGAASSMRIESKQRQSTITSPLQDKLNTLLMAAEEQRYIEQKAKASAQKFKEDMLKRQNDEAMLLLNLIKKEEAKADAILALERAEDDMLRSEQQKLEEEKERIRKENLKQNQLERILKEKEEEKSRLQREEIERDNKAAQNLKEAELAKKEQDARDRSEMNMKKYQYIADAKNMVNKLVDVRASIEGFENSKDKYVSKRRLQMKKVANGKMNTLTHEKEKIEMVARHVSDAINSCLQEDSKVHDEIKSGNTTASREMGLGSRYLMDLIASSVVVRVQAEGFNGYVFQLCISLLLFSYEFEVLTPCTNLEHAVMAFLYHTCLLVYQQPFHRILVY